MRRQNTTTPVLVSRREMNGLAPICCSQTAFFCMMLYVCNIIQKSFILSCFFHAKDFVYLRLETRGDALWPISGWFVYNQNFFVSLPSEMAKLLCLGKKKIKIFCSALDFSYLCKRPIRFISQPKSKSMKNGKV